MNARAALGLLRHRGVPGALVVAVFLAAQLLFLMPLFPSDQIIYYRAAAAFPDVAPEHWQLRIGLLLPVRATMALLGRAEAAYYVVPIAAGALLAWSTYRLGALLFSRRVGVAAGLLGSVNSFILLESSLLPDILAAGLLAAAMTLVVQVCLRRVPGEDLGRPDLIRLGAAGLLLGWSYLAREFVVFLFLLVPLALALWRVPWRPALLAVAAPALAVFAGECLVNAIVHGDPFVRVSVAAGHGQGYVDPAVAATFQDQPVSVILTRLPEALLEHPDGVWTVALLAGLLYVAAVHRSRPFILLAAWIACFWIPLTLLGGIIDPSSPSLRIQKIRYWFPILPALFTGGTAALVMGVAWAARRRPDSLAAGRRADRPRDRGRARPRRQHRPPVGPGRRVPLDRGGAPGLPDELARARRRRGHHGVGGFANRLDAADRPRRQLRRPGVEGPGPRAHSRRPAGVAAPGGRTHRRRAIRRRRAGAPVRLLPPVVRRDARRAAAHPAELAARGHQPGRPPPRLPGALMLEPTDGVATVQGMPFVVPDAERSSVSRRLIATGATEPRFTDVVRRLVAPGDHVLDVGANIGYFTCVMAQRAGRHGRVVAFEPVERPRAYLSHNADANGLGTVTVDGRALADWNGTGYLTLPAYRLKAEVSGGERVAFEVAVRQLDDLAEELRIERVDLVKMDIEGAELRALTGMRSLLARHRPLLAIEVHPAFMAGYGRRRGGPRGLPARAGLRLGGGRAAGGSRPTTTWWPACRRRCARPVLLPNGAAASRFALAGARDWSRGRRSVVDLREAGDALELTFALDKGQKEYLVTAEHTTGKPPAAARAHPLNGTATPSCAGTRSSKGRPAARSQLFESTAGRCGGADLAPARRRRPHGPARQRAAAPARTGSGCGWRAPGTVRLRRLELTQA